MLGAVVAVMAAATGTSTSATSSGPVVSMTVPSATNLSIAGCPASSRTFGTVLPGTSAITPDCVVTFGSSNDVSRLRMYQADRTGSAMWSWSTGNPDTTWNAAPAGIREVTPSNGHGYGGLAVAPTGEVYKGARTTCVCLGVARFASTGALDTAWNTDGYAQVSVGAPAYPMDVTLDSSDRIVVAGSSDTGSGEGIVLARMATTGNPDTTFGGSSTGWVYVDPDPATTYTIPSTVWNAPDGRIWVSGCTTNTSSTPCAHGNGVSMFVARFSANGVLDSSFATGGVLKYTPAGQTANGKLVPTNEGGALVMGRDGANVVLVKLRDGGSLDTTFGTSGVASVALTGVANPVPWGGTVLDDGTIVAIGKNGTHTATWIAHWTSAGVLDTTWGGGDGIVILDLFPGANEYPESNDLVPTGDGGGFIGGTWLNGATDEYFVAKFLPDGSLDPAYGGGDGITTRTATSAGSQHGGLAASEGRVYLGGGAGRIQVLRFGGDGGPIPDYVNPTTNFASAGGAFGACLRTSSTATNTWTPAPGANCAGDGSHWNGVPRTSSAAGAEIATAGSSVMTATATLRFGVAASLTAKGAFRAPITFEVVSP